MIRLSETIAERCMKCSWTESIPGKFYATFIHARAAVIEYVKRTRSIRAHLVVSEIDALMLCKESRGHHRLSRLTIEEMKFGCEERERIDGSRRFASHCATGNALSHRIT